MDNSISRLEEFVPGPSIRIKRFILLLKEWHLCLLKITGSHSRKVMTLRAECIAYWQRIHSLENFRSAGPPPLAIYLLQFIGSEDVIGDTLEGYAETKKKKGQKSADRWCYSQVFRSAWPLISTALREIIRILIDEWLRRRF